MLRYEDAADRLEEFHLPNWTSKVAQALGVAQQDMVLESESRDTEESAKAVAPIVQKDPFLLVTSASHMPRSMAMRSSSMRMLILVLRLISPAA